jgi:small subunit ribosomal protein S18
MNALRNKGENIMAERKKTNTKKRFNNNNSDDDYSSKYKKLRKKVCFLCSDKNFVLDYKNADSLRKFINEKGKILPRRATGACAQHQRDITMAVKRARHIAILPYAAS